MANPSTIAETTTIVGRVVAEGDLVVQGHVEGSIEVAGELTVTGSAELKSNIAANRVTVAGAVAGDVRGAELVVLEAGARVVGDVLAPTIGVRAGALIRGRVDSTGGRAAGAAAKPTVATAKVKAEQRRPHEASRGAARPKAPGAKRAKAKKAKRAAPAPVMPKASGRAKKAPAKKRRAAAPTPKVPALRKRRKKAVRRRAR